MRKLRIAQVSSLWEKTPPPLYGGTERIVYYLTEGLVKKGHKVTLFATGDSKTSGKLKSIYPRALYRDNVPWTNALYPLLHHTNVFEQARNFDLIHVHFNTRQDYIALALAGFVKTPTLFTIHCVLPKKNEKEKRDRFLLLQKYRKRNFATISRAQQTLKFLNYVGVAYNGLDFSRFKFFPKPKNYLVWLGRICQDKGTFEAIQVAKKTKMKLFLAGKIDWANYDYLKYYKEKIKPEIDGKNISYLGELNDKEKTELMGNAKAVLNPINWNEPFSLVTIEAMALGTPVIAFRRGPIPEQIINGKTGYIVRNVNEMAGAVKKIEKINRGFCRQHAISNFNFQKMVESYEKIYQKILSR